MLYILGIYQTAYIKRMLFSVVESVTAEKRDFSITGERS